MNFNILVYVKKLIVFVLFLSVNLIYSQELYVSQPLGSDSNSGSESSPFKTINKAISESIPGTTILVMDGLYQNNNYGTGLNGTSLNNSAVVNFNQSGVTGSPITLKILMDILQRFNLMVLVVLNFLMELIILLLKDLRLKDHRLQ